MRSSINLLKPDPASLRSGKIQLVKRDGMIGRVSIRIEAVCSRCPCVGEMSQFLEDGLAEQLGPDLILCAVRGGNALLLQGFTDGLDKHHCAIIGRSGIGPIIAVAIGRVIALKVYSCGCPGVCRVLDRQASIDRTWV